MKTIKERILFIVLVANFGLALVGYMFVRGAIRHFDNYVSFIMLATGIVLMLLFLIVLWIALRFSKKKVINEELKFFNQLASWNKYVINLDTIQIKSNKWNDSHFVRSLGGDIEIKQENIQTILEFELEIKGEKKQFHWPCNLETKSLEMYFAIQKETSFYLDPNDHSNYYLDLNFIGN